MKPENSKTAFQNNRENQSGWMIGPPAGPSPQPCPVRRGRIVLRLKAALRQASARQTFEFFGADNGCLLSSRERVRVRGNGTSKHTRAIFFQRPS